MTVQAKVRCIGNMVPQYSEQDAEGPRVVRFTPVWDPDPSSPNHEWSQATPSGYMELYITNPGAYGTFTVGAEYMISFEEVPAS